MGFPRWHSGKESACQCERCRCDLWVEKIPWRRNPLLEMATHSSILAWEILWTEKHGGLYSMGPKESDMTEQLSTQHIIYRKLKGYSKKSKLTEKFNQNLNTENPYCYFILPSMYRYVYSIPGSGRSPGEGNDTPLLYSCLGNSMDRAAWWATYSP